MTQNNTYYDSYKTPDWSPFDDFLNHAFKRLTDEIAEDGVYKETEDILDQIINLGWAFLPPNIITEYVRIEKREGDRERILYKYRLLSQILRHNDWLIHKKTSGLRDKIEWKKRQLAEKGRS